MDENSLFENNCMPGSLDQDEKTKITIPFLGRFYEKTHITLFIAIHYFMR